MGIACARSVRCTSLLSAGILFLALDAHAQGPELFQPDDSSDGSAATASSAESDGKRTTSQTNNRVPGRFLGFNFQIMQGQAVLEGDILLGKVNANGHLTGTLSARGVGLSSMFSRWPNGIVPYAFDDNSQVQRDNIARAISHWTSRSRISFVERTSENSSDYPNYITFTSTSSCASHVGMVGGGSQPIFVSDSCTTGSIIHEIGHALGLFHEHTRPDRDNYVSIDWSRITPGKEINFEILDTGIENYGEYDYGSIMHYGESFFSATGEPVITVPDGVQIGQRIALSEKDVAAVNQMYATDLILNQPVIVQTEQGVEINLSMRNAGRLGAHKIQLLAQLGDNVVWQGMSTDSDWTCVSVNRELQCSREIFAGESQSSLSILADPGNASIEDLALNLSARTLDTDTGNNSYNDQDTQWQSLIESNDRSSGTTEPTSTIKEQPQLAAASNTELASATNSQATATLSPSTGQSTRGMLLMLLMAVVWRGWCWVGRIQQRYQQSLD